MWKRREGMEVAAKIRSHSVLLYCPYFLPRDARSGEKHSSHWHGAVTHHDANNTSYRVYIHACMPRMQERYKKRAENNTEPLQLQVRPVDLRLFLESGADEDRESDDQGKRNDWTHDSSENNRQFSCPTCDISWV
jgi:hypothetical protein